MGVLPYTTQKLQFHAPRRFKEPSIPLTLGQVKSLLLSSHWSFVMPRGSSKKKGKKSRGSRPARLGPTHGAGVPGANLGADTLLGIPQTQKRELVIAAPFVLTSTSGAYSETVIPLNDAFAAWAGLSAAGYAKYMAFYSKCFVLGSRLRVRAVWTPISGAPAVVGIAVSSLASSFASANAAIEAGLCQWDVVAVNPDRIRHDITIDIRKFLNVPSILSSSQLYSTSAASPSLLVEAHVFADCVGSGTGSLTVQFENIMECVFTDPIPFT